MLPFVITLNLPSFLIQFEVPPSCSSVIFIVFIEQPNSSSMPIGTQVNLRCSVEEKYGIRWGITFPDGSAPISTAEPGAFTALVSRGITPVPSSITAQEAMLIINGTQSNNGVTVECVAALLTDPATRSQSEAAIVVFYGTSK